VIELKKMFEQGKESRTGSEPEVDNSHMESELRRRDRLPAQVHKQRDYGHNHGKLHQMDPEGKEGKQQVTIPILA